MKKCSHMNYAEQCRICLRAEIDRLRGVLRDLVSEPDCISYPERGVYDEPIYSDAPFWSEAALYELVGKEAARTLLARHKRAVVALAGTADQQSGAQE